MIKKITLARHYGFCMGVKRAINIARDTAEQREDRVTILNEIVHNDAVVQDFRDQGVGQQFKVADVNEGTLIVSAHGVAPSVKEEAAARGLNVVDATCPLVSRIYDIILEQIPKDFHIIHFGDNNHDETIGVVGHAPDRITVISSVEELDNYPDWSERKLGLTVQTTMGLKEYEVFREAAKHKWPHIEVFDTICNATNKRQTSIMELAPEVDMILVVGSTTSANSNRLVSIARKLTKDARLIGSAEDISEDWFVDGEIESVGISAGASTPDFLVQEVMQRLQDISGGTAEVTQQEKKKKRRAGRSSASASVQPQ